MLEADITSGSTASVSFGCRRCLFRVLVINEASLGKAEINYIKLQSLNKTRNTPGMQWRHDVRTWDSRNGWNVFTATLSRGGYILPYWGTLVMMLALRHLSALSCRNDLGLEITTVTRIPTFTEYHFCWKRVGIIWVKTKNIRVFY